LELPTAGSTRPKMPDGTESLRAARAAGHTSEAAQMAQAASTPVRMRVLFSVVRQENEATGNCLRARGRLQCKDSGNRVCGRFQGRLIRMRSTCHSMQKQPDSCPN